MIGKKLMVLGILSVSINFFSHSQIRLGMATSLQNDSMLYAAGFRLIGTTVGSLISPDISDSLFMANVEAVKELQCDVIMCNVLFPGKIKIAGPDVNETQVLTYLESVLKRAQIAGVRNLILGSGGARRIPDNYDKEKAKADFVRLARKMAPLAQKYEVRIILENLNSTETNFLNKLRDAADVVRKVDHPAFRLNADIYHMMREDESPEEIVNAKGLVVYSEIAEENGRTLPGMNKEDFRPYLKALKKIKFKGPIIMEGNSENLATDAPAAFRYLDAQIGEVF